MNVLFVHPPAARRSYIAQFALPEPLAQMYLAPVLRDRHGLRFVDLRLSRDLARALARLGGFRPEAAVVGVNPLTVASLGAVLGGLRGRYPGLKILLHADAEYGNAHVSERPQDFLHPLADALVEPYFLARQREIVSATLDAWQAGRALDVPGLWVREERGWRATEKVPNVVGMIGVPDRTLLGEYRGRYRFGGIARMAHLFYTYGCRFKCRFCPMSKHDGSIVTLPVEEVVEDLRGISEPHVYLQDFEPFLAPDAMNALAGAIERAGIRKRWYMLTRADSALAQRELIARWQRLGLSWLYLGLDGDSARRLEEVRKSSTVETNERALRAMLDLGLSVTVGFVVRADYGREDFAALRAYVARLRAPMVTFTVETPMVGTTLFDETQRELTTRDWSLYDLEHAVLPTALPLDEFYRELARLHFAAGLRTIPTMLAHYPLRDVLCNWAAGMGSVWRLRRSARDHEVPLRRGLVEGPAVSG
jgi:magnesium-protoporphyrin IX monomethyl ester (oxidative) cyclase